MAKLAQIVKSETGYWVGKEIHPNESYMSFDKVRFFHPVEKIVEVDFPTLEKDIEAFLGVTISTKTPETIVKKIATELCSSEHGMIYLLDWKSPFGVRKVFDAPAG